MVPRRSIIKSMTCLVWFAEKHRIVTEKLAAHNPEGDYCKVIYLLPIASISWGWHPSGLWWDDGTDGQGGIRVILMGRKWRFDSSRQ